MKILLATIAAMVLVGCGESQQTSPQPETGSQTAPINSIHDAAKKGDIEAIKQYLADNANVNSKDSKGMTPLHAAAIRNHKEIAQLLIAEGADVDCRAESDDTTPLHQAAGGGHKSVCELLIQNGSDINAICKFGSPLDVSIHFNQDETAELLKRLGAKHKNLYFAVRAKDEESVKELLSNGANVNSRNNPLQSTSLIYASLKGYTNITKILISNGAEVNDMIVNKLTALHAASSKGHLEIVDILINNNADINPVSYKLGKSETPLDAALVNGFIEVSDLLRKHGGKTGDELKAEGK